jgi:hypothetical protein
MNINEQTSALIKTMEASIADKEKRLNDLDFEIKVEKAQLRKIKKVFDDNKPAEKAVDKNG